MGERVNGKSIGIAVHPLTHLLIYTSTMKDGGI
jgi:hypothetical protein